MKFPLKKLFLLSITLITAVSSYSQSKINNLRIEFIQDSSTSTNINIEPGMYIDPAVFKVLFHVDVNRIKEIDAVEISMGSTMGGSEYFLYTVNINGKNLPQNVNIIPRKKEILIDAGKYELLSGPYYAQARLKYSNGKYSAWEKEDAPSPRKN